MQREIPKWIRTYTGKRFFPLDPIPEAVDIEDIAHALSNQCRFSGHTWNFYSVAEHSVFVSHTVKALGGSVVEQIQALLHDASEAYAVDVPTPVKRQIVGYADIEDRLMRTIFRKFGLPEEMPDIIKEADEILLATEARDLMHDPQDWGIVAKPLESSLNGCRLQYPKNHFLKLFDELNADLIPFQINQSWRPS
jgi:hypothetical protein